ncbi:helix-turn-helix domain-containing protein [Saxibacter everestensis]|uniref:Helix-turn-helix domain-containing protein n=1 Tax=Saxibacter everestensis TaxID=2909229 RepID=A0ABY8QSK5_9MICO|nr:helix-turn-helix domain-containing protein [Brevibacteriaceae bacterium ZFBP1038]
MAPSAKILDETLGLRERKKLATTRSLTSTARRLAAERGIDRFTIEDLADEAGISRRTFFNYFSSKEEALLGVHHKSKVTAAAQEVFLTDGPTGHLLQDLLTVVAAGFDDPQPDPKELRNLKAALQQSPRLLELHLRKHIERSSEIKALIAQREGLAPDHPSCILAANLLSAILQSSSEIFLAEGNTSPFDEIVSARLKDAPRLFAK